MNISNTFCTYHHLTASVPRARALIPGPSAFRSFPCIPSSSPSAGPSSLCMDLSQQQQQQLQITATAALFGQEHVLEGWASLGEAERQSLLQDLQDVDFKYIDCIYKASMAAGAVVSPSEVAPYDNVLGLKDGSPDEREAWRQRGLELIAQGKAAVLLLAGGQGTRLGSSLPKGCYNVGLPSKKSLFQIQAERLKKVQQLAAASASTTSNVPAPGDRPKPIPLLHWYIMTSPFTHLDTLSHFEAHLYFGLEREQVHFFQQGFLPCLTEEGKVIMETSSQLAKAPDGNGGVYLALHRSGCLDHMVSLGIDCLDVYCVDNALARLADPLFLGYCHTKGVQVGARVVAKAYPEEKVGVFAKRGGALAVLEYSELDPGVATASDPGTGRLLYNWSNICMHYFAVQWLTQVCTHLQDGSPYHVAKKKVPSKDGPVQGIKLELFIFDTFHLAPPDKLALMEVERSAEFAPVKNAPGSASDSPDTARAAVLALHSSWVQAAGGQVVSPEGVEVSPLVSYAGEGLHSKCKGNVFDSTWSELLQGPQDC